MIRAIAPRGWFVLGAIVCCTATGCVVPALVMDAEDPLCETAVETATTTLTADRLPVSDMAGGAAVPASAPMVEATPMTTAPLLAADSLNPPPLGAARAPLEYSVVVRQSESPRVASTARVVPAEPPRVFLTQIQPEPANQASGDLQVVQRIKPLRDISLNITPPQLVSDQQQPIALPTNFAAGALPAMAVEQPFTRGDMVAAGYEWHPSPEGLTFCYQPLYFEEVNLERYGRSFGIFQPLVSATAFYSRIPALPYMVFARPARRCTNHAHWTLPGYKLPAREPQPLVPSITGAAAEVAVIYGLILLIP